MSKRVAVWALVAAFSAFVYAVPARANQIRVTAGFTSFSGVIVGGGQTFFVFCGADTCAGPPAPPVPTCPDAGCGVTSGVANFSLGGDPSRDTTNGLEFYVAFNDPRNELDFKAVGLVNDADPTGFKLGTLTFANGLWSGSADLRFGIVANDLTTHRTEAFNGFIHLTLTSPNTGTPQQNADFIYITNAAGTPVVNPLTLAALPSVRAYELADSPTGSNTVSVDLFGMFGSLDFLRFDNVVGGGFLDTSLTPELGGPPATIPVPGTLALLGVALGGLGVVRRYKLL